MSKGKTDQMSDRIPVHGSTGSPRTVIYHRFQKATVKKKMLSTPVFTGVMTCYFLSMGVFFTCFTINPDFDLGDQHAVHINNILLGLKKARMPA